MVIIGSLDSWGHRGWVEPTHSQAIAVVATIGWAHTKGVLVWSQL